MKIEFNTGDKANAMPLKEIKKIFKDISEDIQYGAKYGNIRTENGSKIGQWYM